MIQITEAVESAVQYMKALYPGRQIGDVLLEEVELSDDDKVWTVTISFLLSETALMAVLKGRPTPTGRLYKEFRIRTDTGEVRSMKIRKI